MAVKIFVVVNSLLKIEKTQGVLEGKIDRAVKILGGWSRGNRKALRVSKNVTMHGVRRWGDAPRKIMNSIRTRLHFRIPSGRLEDARFPNQLAGVIRYAPASLFPPTSAPSKKRGATQTRLRARRHALRFHHYIAHAAAQTPPHEWKHR